LRRWSTAIAVLLLHGVVATAGAAEPANVHAEAEALYLDGLEHLAGGSLIEAEQEFQKVARLPSYVTLTALARLRLADVQFYGRKFDEAIEAYHTFVRRHEGNENVPYALFMVAKSHVELAPSDLWVLPPVYELDLAPVQQARTELERFVRTYPRSPYVTEALALRDHCIDLQYAHARYVIGFYAERQQWTGVVYRLHTALQAFADRAHTEDHYALLVRGYEMLGWRQRAVELWQAIARRWPQSQLAARAPAQISKLQGDIAAARQRGEAAELPPDAPPTAAVKPELMGQGP
jgi:outer membrane protein assembly factor BamD